MRRRQMILTVFWLALAAAVPALISFAPYPFVFIFVLWIAGLVWLSVKSFTSTGRAVCVNLIVVLALLLALETHWVRKNNLRTGEQTVSIYSPEYIETDSLLGFKPAINHIEPVTKIIEGEHSYTATYTIGSDGLRIMPEPPQLADENCLLFFGGSFTYGEGVNDHETMPYLVSHMVKRKALNFGFHAYGPSQMLIAIEQGEVLKQLDCNPIVAIYQAIPDHVKRTAGLGRYAERGPRYVADTESGMSASAVYEGQYSKVAGPAVDESSVWTLLFGKSYMYREYFIDRDWVGDDEVDLYLTVVATARNRLREKYPGIEFAVVFWDTYGRSFSDDLDEGLIDIADHYFRITDMLPDIVASPERYKLRGDAHPNALAYRIMAEHLAAKFGPAGSGSD